MANSSQGPRVEDPDNLAEDEESEKSFVKHGPADSKSIDSSRSSDDEEDDDEVSLSPFPVLTLFSRHYISYDSTFVSVAK